MFTTSRASTAKLRDAVLPAACYYIPISAVRSGHKVGQIGTKSDKSDTFMYPKLFLESFRLVSFGTRQSNLTHFVA